jgi:outer membrane scaffolding protein for murein synthesis (MipA/OmpV family)
MIMKIEVKTLTAVVIATGSMLFGISAAPAQDVGLVNRDSVSGTVAGGIAAVPEYEGADKIRVIPLVSGKVLWGNRYVAIEGATARINLLSSDSFEFGPSADLTFGRDTNVGSLPVRKLGRIDDAYQIGAFAAMKFGSIVTNGDELRFSVQATRDVSDVHQGWLGDAAVSYRLAVSKKFAVNGQASLRFADDKYARTYFSVNSAKAAASRLAPFAPKGGVKDIGLSLTTTYAISDRWSLIGFGGYRRLVGDFADSPIVKTAGDPNQFTGGIGVGFSF